MKVWLDNPELCPKCGQTMKVIAVISSPSQDEAIEKILKATGDWDPPWLRERTTSKARAPPAPEYDDSFFQERCDDEHLIVGSRRPPARTPADDVKRVVGVSGDELEIRSKKLFRNGIEIEEPYVIHSEDSIIPSRSPLAWRDHLPLTAVPPAYLFVMGDNRDVSGDSRLWGPIPAHVVVGRVVEILEPGE